MNRINQTLTTFGLILSLVHSLACSSASAAEFCITGVKGTLASSYTIKLAHASNSERTLTLLDSNKNVLFSGRAENRFTQFNSSGYGVCSIASSRAEGGQVQYKLELKVTTHVKSECTAVDLPVSSDYFTLKVIPKGTTLGDDLTAYAVTIIPCNN